MNKLGVFCFSVLISIAVTGVFFLAVSNGIPVGLSVADVLLGRLPVVAPGNNGTASVTHKYKLSFAVSVYNPNTVMRVWRVAQLDAELHRRGGRPFARVRLAGAEPERIRQMRSKVYRVAVTVPKSVAVALERDRPDAEAASRLELIVHGEFKYVPSIGSTSINTTVRCPLRLPQSTVAFARFGIELSELCTDITIEQLTDLVKS